MKLKKYKNGEWINVTEEFPVKVGGLSAELTPLTVTENGTYTAPEGKAYTPVTVNVSGGGGLTFTGHLDEEGLSAIGWTDDDIAYWQENGVYWNEESDDVFKLTEKDIAGDDSDQCLFLPKNTDVRNFEEYYNMIGMPLIDTSDITDFSYMFDYCERLRTIPLIDTSNGTDFSGMLGDNPSLRTVPLIDMSKAENMYCMFAWDYGLKTIPALNTSNVTNFERAFYDCYSLESVPELDMSSAETCEEMFCECYSINTFPDFNTTNCTNFSGMFGSCYSMSVIPSIDTSKGEDFSYMFENCEINHIPLLDMGCATNISNMFSSCDNIRYVDGFTNLGKAYGENSQDNKYKLYLSDTDSLTHEAIENIIDSVWDCSSHMFFRYIYVSTYVYNNVVTGDDLNMARAKNWIIMEA